MVSPFSSFCPRSQESTAAQRERRTTTYEGPANSQRSANLTRNLPHSAEFATSARKRPTFGPALVGQTWPELGQIWPEVCQVWATLVVNRPNLASDLNKHNKQCSEISQIWPELTNEAILLSDAAKVGPESAKLARSSSRVWPPAGGTIDILERCLSNLKNTCHMCYTCHMYHARCAGTIVVAVLVVCIANLLHVEIAPLTPLLGAY